jgi:DHA1 family bicyclomycin/chloramphenicol resistance-like MFS transporter
MQSRARNLSITLILGTLTTISPFSIDLYLPAFAQIAEHFDTTTARVSLSLSSYFIGLALGQVFYGPLLDRFGRKRPLYFGIALYLLSTAACIVATSIEGFIAVRFLQALGGCAASVASTAMVRDFFSPADGAKVFSRLMLILSVSPLFAPSVGGWIASEWGWQALFITLIVIVTLIFLGVFFFLPEGHAPDPSVSLHPKIILQTFASIARDRTFFAFAVTGAFSFAGLFTYLAGAPSIFFDRFHLTEREFGLIFAGLSVGMIGGGQINILLMKRFSSQQIFKTALRLQAIVAIVFTVGCAFHAYNLTAHLVILFAYISCIGLTYPNAVAVALAGFAKNAGSASALLGTLQMGIGALASAMFGLQETDASSAVARIFLVTSLTGVAIYQYAISRSSRSV